MAESPLRAELDAAMCEHGMTMDELTVLDKKVDPFRLDTPANHRDAKWLADTKAAVVGSRRIHNRGLHYAILGQSKPDGTIYSGVDWSLLEKASKLARWLGYIPFDEITDHRNDEPVVRIHGVNEPWPYLNAGIDVRIPRADEITPKLGVLDFEAAQPYRLVIVGEKSSLFDVLDPIARDFDADLYLPTGCISDTHIYRIAKTAGEDGRPMVLLYFADCDPSGHNMGIEVSRKLAALKVTYFPALEFEVHRAALTIEQVREFELPSTPLKETETRGARWREAFGVEQTEIDALSTLRPDLLRQAARDAIAPFYDFDLDRRVRQAYEEWTDRALVAVNEQLDRDRLGRVRAEAEHRLTLMRQQINELNEQLRIDVDDFDLPEIVIPQAQVDGRGGLRPLVDSRWSFAEQTHRLIDSRNYRPATEGGWSQ